uniref:Sema domain-containing protein n=1 Tax=Gasterosteus aculeatus aculeatus TaxID=481459 RepID=A0AAQ4P720_GASAC
MLPLRLTVYVFFICVRSLTATSPLPARMTFTEKDMAMKRLPLPRHHVPVEIILEGEHETVIAAGHKHLTSLNFQNTTSVEISVPWSDPRPSEDRNFNITVVHKREADNVFFLCGTNGMKTLCCDMIPQTVISTLHTLDPKRMLASTSSGNTELLREDTVKVDRGGSKNILQFSWTSQMNARLSCGHADSRQHFSELVDVTTVHAEQWEQTRIYALFRNEWGMSAVCVYTIEDIEQIFKTSPFKDADEQTGRPRECVADSTNIPKNVLKMIQMNSEMKESVQPVDNSGPLLSNHHLYTHIHVHGSPNNRHPTVLFLSLNNGAIHKVMQDESRTFVIAEYQPFNHRAHVVSIRLDPPSRKLYVSSRTEVVQLNVANCSQYGDSCELCVLARDPYCGWDGTRCTPETEGTLQDLTQGNHDICASKVQPHPKASGHFTSTHAEEESLVTLPLKAKYFLRCPVSSHHAQYTWHHHGSSTSCSWSEQWCLFLVDSMGPEQEGTYTCVSEEMGYRRELAQHELQVSGEAAGRWRSPLVWLCLAAALIQSWC